MTVPSLDKPQKLFIQRASGFPFLREQSLHKLIKQCVQSYEGQLAGDRMTDELIAGFLRPIYDALDYFGMALKKTIDHTSGEPVYAIVNVVDDQFAKMATSYSPVQINYLKHIIALIIQNRRKYYLYETEAVNAGRSIPATATQQSQDEHQEQEESSGTTSISVSNAAAYLEVFVKDGWLRKSRSGAFSLSPRIFLELDQYLENEYEEFVEKCKHCEKLVSFGKRCSSLTCDYIVHYHCAKTVFRSQIQQNAETVSCPKCHSDWPINDQDSSNNESTDTRRQSSRRSINVAAGLPMHV